MPWDLALNHDIHNGVEHHVTLTKDLLEVEPKSFSMITRKSRAHTCKRILDPVTGSVPSSKWIMEDIHQVLLLMASSINTREHLLQLLATVPETVLLLPLHL